MNVSEAISTVRSKIHDNDVIEMSNDDILVCLNEALQLISVYLIAADSPLMVNDMTVSAATAPLPDNFVKTAGGYPIKITQNTMRWLDYEAGKTLKVRYFATAGTVTADGTMPFAHDALNQIAIREAAIYCGNQLEADVSQDMTLTDETKAALSSLLNKAVSGQ